MVEDGPARPGIAVVTGASSGIGAELARQLAGRGMSVALVARRAERLARLAAEIEQGGGRASVHPCDVGQRGSVESTAREIVAQWGGVDLLANAAGVARHVLFKDHDLDDMERIVRTNLLGTLYWSRTLLPQLRASEHGRLINLSSFAGKLAQPDEAVYSASKFAVSGLSRALAMEFAPLGIQVLCVHPALVRTEMFTPEVMARMPRGGPAFLEPPDFVGQLLRALDRGATEVTLPRRYGLVPALAALLPGPIHRAVARAKLAPLDDVES